MHQQVIMEATKRLLKVALVGAPNAGKSTLLNKLVMHDISCVSNKVHTTRKNILAAYTAGETQLAFFDSPGLVTREHLLKHRLEDSLAKDPEQAAQSCDLIAVVVDASNPREKKRLNKGLLRMLNNHNDKTSFLILNKVDLIKAKRDLLDISSRLTEGCIENKSVIDKRELKGIMKRRILNRIEPTSKYVIELDKNDRTNIDDPISNRTSLEEIGYKNFSQIFSISALNDDGVDALRDSMLELSKPVELWPHGADYVSSNNSRETVQSIIRGKVMDYTDQQIPYVVKYKFLQCVYDDFESLHVDLKLIVPNRYMVGKLVGENGVTVFKIINESRDMIQRVLGCDVKLNIAVESRDRGHRREEPSRQ